MLNRLARAPKLSPATSAFVALILSLVSSASAQTPATPVPAPTTPAAQAKAQALEKLKDLGRKAIDNVGTTPAPAATTPVNPLSGGSNAPTNPTATQNAIGVISGLGKPSPAPSSTSLSQGDAETGMRQALSLGVDAVTARLGKVDGFFKDSKVHIPLPGSFAKIQNSLRPIGGAKILNDLELSMNRAAEAAMPQAKALFTDAIRNMSAESAIAIVRGGPSSATEYLKSQTQAKLVTAFQPIMEQNLEKTGAFQALAAGTQKYGAPDLSGTARSNLSQFAVTKALDGMFYYVGEEEAAIRANPAKQSTALLKTIFGQIAGPKSPTVP